MPPKKVLRSLYFDPDVDQMLGAWADREGTSKADLIRRLIEEGLQKAATPKPSVENTIFATLQRIEEHLAKLDESVSGLANEAQPPIPITLPADEGVGLSADARPRVMEAFVSPDPSAKKRTGKAKNDARQAAVPEPDAHPGARRAAPKR